MYPTIFKGNVEVRTGVNPAQTGSGKLLVENDATIGGDKTRINSTSLTIADNLPIVNYPPLMAGRDIGILGARNINDVLSGPPTEVGTTVSATLNTIALEPGSSSADDYYLGYVILITSGTGAGQNRIIESYSGSTRVATVDSDWTVIPDATSMYNLYGNRNVVFGWIENGKYFSFGTTPDEHVTIDLRTVPGNLAVDNLVVGGSITGLEEIVCLQENSGTPQPITKSDLRGSYLIVVKSVADGGASATFSASKSNAASVGNTFRITSATGSSGETIDIEWNVGEKINLYHSTLGPDGNTLCYEVRTMSIDILGGENNVGANVGNLGYGPYNGKTGLTLDFRNTAAGSNRIAVDLDLAGKNILLDINESNLTLDNLGGVLSVVKGGTSLNNLTSGRFLIGNGIGPVDLSKQAPVGDVLGTTDPQTMSNKTITDPTNNVVANSLRNDTGVVNISGPAPIAGYTLVATSATTAVWNSGGGGGMSEFEYMSSVDPVTTTWQINDGGATKLDWTTSVKPAGTYRIGWSYNYSIQTTTRDFICLLLIDNQIKSMVRFGVVSNAGGSNDDPYSLIGSGNNQNLMNSGFKYVTFGSAGTHQIVMKFGTSSNGSGFEPVSMSDLVVEIWKVF